MKKYTCLLGSSATKQQQTITMSSLMEKHYALPNELTTFEAVNGAYNDAHRDIGQFRRALCDKEVHFFLCYVFDRRNDIVWYAVCYSYQRCPNRAAEW